MPLPLGRYQVYIESDAYASNLKQKMVGASGRRWWWMLLEEAQTNVLRWRLLGTELSTETSTPPHPPARLTPIHPTPPYGPLICGLVLVALRMHISPPSNTTHSALFCVTLLQICGSVLVALRMQYHEWWSRALVPGQHFVEVTHEEDHVCEQVGAVEVCGWVVGWTDSWLLGSRRGGPHWRAGVCGGGGVCVGARTVRVAVGSSGG